MFDLINKNLIKNCYPVLENLWKNQKNLYIELFFHEKDVELKKMEVKPLLKTKIIKKVKDKFRANVFVFPLAGKFIVSDFLISLHKVKDGRYLRGRDDVWAILAYESPYIAKKAIVKKGDYVLDLACGSGIIALFCADKATKVIATDINPKAINYARFNAILNGLENKIDFRVGDMFEPVKGTCPELVEGTCPEPVEGEKFDLIVWNGPTLAIPDVPEKYPIYCFGGPDGLDFTKRFIEEAPQYLKSEGRMQWLDPSLGNEKNPRSLEVIKEGWKNRGFRVIYEQRVKPSLLSKLYEYVEKRLIFNPTKGLARPLWLKPLTKKEYSEWLEFLKKNKFTHIHAGMYKIYSSKKFKIIRQRVKKILFPRMNYLPQEWHFLSITRIKQLLKICEGY